MPTQHQKKLAAGILAISLSGCWQDDVYINIEGIPSDATALMVRPIFLKSAPYRAPQRDELQALGLEGQAEGRVKVAKSALWKSDTLSPPALISLEVAAIGPSGCKVAGTRTQDGAQLQNSAQPLTVDMNAGIGWPQEITAVLSRYPTAQCTIQVIPIEPTAIELPNGTQCPKECQNYLSEEFDISKTDRNCTEACQTDQELQKIISLTPASQQHGVRFYENGDPVSFPLSISQPHQIYSKYSPSWCSGDALCLYNPLVTQTINSIWKHKDDDIWAVGNFGLILHYDGKRLVAYTASDSDKTVQDDLFSVFGSDDGRVVWAVGAGGRALRLSGSQFIAVQTGTTRLLEGVWVTPDGQAVWMAGSDRTLLKTSGDGTARDDYTETLKAALNATAVLDLRAIYGDRQLAAPTLWIGANSRYVISFNTGTKRVEYAQVPDSSESLRSIAVDRDTVWAVGETNTVWKKQGSDNWTNYYPVGLGTKLRSVWVSDSPAGVFVAGSINMDGVQPRGTVRFSSDGRSWTGADTDIPMNQSVTAGAGGLSSGFLVGGGGVLLARSGMQAPYEDLNPIVDLYAAHSLASGETWLGGAGSFFMRFKDGVWTRSPAQSAGAAVRAIFGADIEHLWAVGTGGAIWNNTGSGWQQVASPVSVDLNDISGTNEGEAWAIGSGGTVLYLESASGSWRALGDLGIRDNLYGVRAVGPGQAWIVGSRGTIGRMNGTKFESYADRARIDWDLYSVTSLSDQIYAVGSSGEIVQFNGKEFKRSTITQESGATLRKVFSPPAVSAQSGMQKKPPQLWVIGSDRALYSLSESGSWRSMRSPIAQPIFGISGSSPRDIWFAGTQGAVLRYQPQ